MLCLCDPWLCIPRTKLRSPSCVRARCCILSTETDAVSRGKQIRGKKRRRANGLGNTLSGLGNTLPRCYPSIFPHGHTGLAAYCHPHGHTRLSVAYYLLTRWRFRAAEKPEVAQN